MKKLLCLALTVGSPVLAGDPEAGRELAQQCTVCHGEFGVSEDDEVPNIAGQSAFYLEKSLGDYKTGVRQDPRMSIMAQGLDDAQIEDLAAWFSSVEVIVTPPD